MHKTESMSLVKGAVNSLQILSEQHNIIILSNIPFKFYEKRKVALKKMGLIFLFLQIQVLKEKQ